MFLHRFIKVFVYNLRFCGIQNEERGYYKNNSKSIYFLYNFKKSLGFCNCQVVK